MYGNDTSSHDLMDSDTILNIITNQEIPAHVEVENLCRKLSISNLKKAYLDCRQHGLIMQNKPQKEVYEKRCRQMLLVMCEHIKMEESNYRKLISEQPTLASDLVTRLLQSTGYIAQVIDHPEEYNWRVPTFLASFEQALLKLPLTDCSTLNRLEKHSRFCQKTLGLDHWYDWLHRMSHRLPHSDFFKLLNRLDHSQKLSVQFLNQNNDHCESLWQGYFDSLSNNQLQDLLIGFLSIAGGNKQAPLISACYAKAVVNKFSTDDTDDSLIKLLERLTDQTLPPHGNQWILLIITELNDQDKLKGDLLIRLISFLLEDSSSSIERQNVLSKAMYFLTKQYVKNGADSWPTSDHDTDIAYHMLVEFDSITQITDLDGWFVTNHHLKNLIDKLDINRDGKKLDDQWLAQGCGKWPQFFKIISSIQSLNTYNGNHLLGELRLKPDDTESKETKKAVSKEYLSPEIIAKQITANQLPRRLSVSIDYWDKILSDIVEKIDKDRLYLILQYLPNFYPLVARFWTHPKVQKNSGWLLTQALNMDGDRSQISERWWTGQNEKMIEDLMESLANVLEKNRVSITSLIRLCKFIRQHAQFKQDVNSLVQNWLQCCARVIAVPNAVLPHQWLELEKVVTSMLSELIEDKKLSPDITITQGFTDIFLALESKYKRTTVAVKIAQRHPFIQFQTIIKNNSSFKQALCHMLANMPETDTSSNQRELLFDFLSPDKKIEFAKGQLAKPEWVVEHYGFSQILIKSVDTDFLYQKIKQVADPRPYVDLLILKPYKLGPAKLNIPQVEQLMRVIRDRAHLVRLLQSDAEPENKHWLLTQLLNQHKKTGGLDSFLERLQPDLTCLLLLLNYTDTKTTGEIFDKKHAWFKTLQKWLINPVPAIEIQANSCLHQLVVDGFCTARFHYVPNLTLIEQLEPETAIRVHQSLWQWRHYAQRVHKLFIDGTPNNVSNIVHILNGHWVYRLSWINRLLFPILDIYQQQKNSPTKHHMANTELFQQIMLPLSEDSIPAHSEVMSLFIQSQTQLRRLVRNYLAKIDTELPEHETHLQSVLKEIDNQCAQEKVILPPKLENIIHYMPSFTFPASGGVLLDNGVEVDDLSTTTTPYSRLLEPGWQQSWLKILNQQANTLCKEPSFAPWFFQTLLPRLNIETFDVANVVQELDLETLYNFYIDAHELLAQSKKSYHEWRDCQSAPTLSKLINKLYCKEPNTLKSWSLLARQNNCVLLTDLLSFLASAKQVGLSLLQVERLLPPDQLPSDCQSTWWHNEWSLLIDNAEPSQSKMVQLYEQKLLDNERSDSFNKLCKLLNQTGEQLTDTWTLFINKYQHNQAKLRDIVSHIKMDQLLKLLNHPNIPYPTFMQAFISHLQTHNQSINPYLLIQSWRKNHWPMADCLDSITNSKNPQLTSCLSLYCLTLTDHTKLEGPSIHQALKNQTETHVLAAFSQAILTNQLKDDQWQLVSEAGALALLMDAHHFSTFSDKVFLKLANKTSSSHADLVKKLILSQLKYKHAHTRLRQWYQFAPQLVLCNIEELPSDQQTSAWLNLIDALLSLSPSLIDPDILERLPKQDPILYMAICERAYSIQDNQHPLIKWLQSHGPTKIPELVIKHPKLMPVVMSLANDQRFNSQVIDLKKLASTILLSKTPQNDNHALLFSTMLNQVNLEDGELIAILAKYKAEDTLIALDKHCQNYVQQCNFLKEALEHLTDSPEIRPLFELAYKHAELENNIKEMTGPLQWLRAWFKRLWHRIWVGNSPYIHSKNDADPKQQSDHQAKPNLFERLPKPFSQYTSNKSLSATLPATVPWPKLKSTGAEAAQPPDTSQEFYLSSLASIFSPAGSEQTPQPTETNQKLSV